MVSSAIELLMKQLEWRYACQIFDKNKKISDDLWLTLEQALILTPSSYGLQPWKFVVATSAEVKSQLSLVSYRQPQVESCSHYVVFAYRTELTEKDIQDHVDRIIEVRGVEPEKLERYKKNVKGDLITGSRSKIIQEWAIRQNYIAIGNLMTSAALLGVDTCPMEGIEAAKYDKILGLEGSGYASLMACALGYRSPEDKFQNYKKVRFTNERIIKHI